MQIREYIKKLPPELQNAITAIEAISHRRAMPAYLVGGIVRDMLLGVDNFDLDIVVEGDAIKFADEFVSKLGTKLITHKRFGTATAVIKHGEKIDFATSRKETYPYPAALPLVSRGDLQDDLGRRDFTINAMAFALNKEQLGKFIDRFNGARDLKTGKIRVLHDASFLDDPTRMLRAIRFEQRYGFTIEPHTRALLIDAAKAGMLGKVEPQRLRDELVLILKETDPVKPIMRIQELLGFDFIDSGFVVSSATYATLKLIRKHIGWFKKTHFSRRHLDAWVIYLILLLDATRDDRAGKICGKFAFHRGDKKRVLDYKQINRAYIQKLSRKKIKASQLFKLLEPLSYEVIIALKAKYKNVNLQHNIESFLMHYSGTRIHVNGNDLRELGFTPGPDYQNIFSKVLNAKLDGALKSREEELAFIKGMFKSK